VAEDQRAAVSRTLLEGAARAPARSYLRNIGYSAEDLIIIDVAGRVLDTDADLATRTLSARGPYLRSGALAHYALLVGSASRGAVLASLDDDQAGAQ
jgi:hypothetical protein